MSADTAYFICRWGFIGGASIANGMLIRLNAPWTMRGPFMA
jgi:hypothetical protein